MTSMLLNAKPYTPQEFAKLKAKPFQGQYAKYVSWWSNNVAPKFAAKAGLAGAGVDTSGAQIPGAIQTPAQLTALGNRLFPVQNPAQSLAQARTAISGAYDPVIKSITDAINSQTTQGRSAIEKLTEQFAGRVGNLSAPMQSMYSQAQNQEAGINDALASYIRGQGSTLASGLDNGAAINALGAGAAGAQMGTGVAALDNLISQGASNVAYANKAPSYAYSTGLQQEGAFQNQQGQRLSDMLNNLAGSAASDTSSLYGTLLSNAQSAREGRANLLNEGLGRAATLAATQIGANVDLSGQAAQSALGWGNLAQGAANAKATGKTGQLTPKDRAGATAQAVTNALNVILPYDPSLTQISGGKVNQPVSAYQQVVGRVPKGTINAYDYYLPIVQQYLASALKPLGVSDATILAQAKRALGAREIFPTSYLRPGVVVNPKVEKHRH